MPCPAGGTAEGGPGGDPRKLHAGKACHHRRRRREGRGRSVRPRSAGRGAETSERLGRPRRVVERTLARLNRFRRLAIRAERRTGIHEAFVRLGCDLICLNQIEMAVAKLKAHLRRLEARSFERLLKALGSICDLLTPTEF